MLEFTFAIAFSIPESEGLFYFAPVDEKYNSGLIESTTSPTDEVLIDPLKESFEISVQCLYDFKGNRISRGCPIVERPIKCKKGLLVLTTVGSEFEMCCCNYSSIL